MRPLELSLKRSEHKPPTPATDRTPHFNTVGKQRLNDIQQMINRADDNVVSASQYISAPKPNRVSPLTSRPTNHLYSSSEFIRPLGASISGSIESGQLDRSFGDANLKIFESTESLLIRIQKDLNDSQEHNTLPPIIQPDLLISSQINLSYQMKPCKSEVETCEKPHSFIDFLVKSNLCQPLDRRIFISQISLNSVRSKPKKSNRFAEHDYVSATLSKIRLACHDLTKIEGSEYNKANSIDDRELKSLFCLKSLDLRAIKLADMQSGINGIEREFERESFYCDISAVKPPKSGLRSHRAYDRINEVSPTAARSNILHQGTAGKKNKKLYNSGQDIFQNEDVNRNDSFHSVKVDSNLKRQFSSSNRLTNYTASKTDVLQQAYNILNKIACLVISCPQSLINPINLQKASQNDQLKKSQSKQKPSQKVDIKDHQSDLDTYYLSSETQSLYKSKSSRNVFSQVCFELQSNTQPIDSTTCLDLYRSESGGCLPLNRGQSPNDSCIQPAIVARPIYLSGESRKQSDGSKNKAKTKQFNFFSNCKTSINDTGFQKLISKQFVAIDEFMKINEEDEQALATSRLTYERNKNIRLEECDQ